MENFVCLHCHKLVSANQTMGTKHRNHCPFCLWSKHVDQNVSGDRKSLCLGGMEPLGLTFKHEGLDKWGKTREGELMLIHKCTKCSKISINRIAANDLPETILEVFKRSLDLKENLKQQILQENIQLLDKTSEDVIRVQLFGHAYLDK